MKPNDEAVTTNKPKNANAANIKPMVRVTLAAGCSTFLIAGLFVLIGFLIDRNAGTSPKWMLILLVGSMPFSLGGAYLIAHRAIKRARAENTTVVEGEIVEAQLVEGEDEGDAPEG